MIASLLIATLLLGLGACDDGMDGGKFNHRTDTHEYENQTPPSSEQSPSTQQPMSNGRIDPNNEVRDIWQNPNVVIRKLGDLTGKVVADIGAGPYGYFSLRIANKTNVKKIIAIDIDQDAIRFIENAKIILEEPIRNRIETRLVRADNPQLNTAETDIVIIVNTYAYIENNKEYLNNLKKGIASGGKLVIVDFKKRYTPVGPPINYRVALGDIEQDLMSAGYTSVESDDQTLAYQYIVTAYVD